MPLLSSRGRMQRRTFIAVVGTATILGMAGCQGDDEADSPSEIIEEFYEIAEEYLGEPEAFADEAERFVHSESPLHDFLGMFVTASPSAEEEQPERHEVESIETEVIRENLSVDEMYDRFTLEPIDIDQATIEQFAEENAVVKTKVDFDDGTTEQNEWFFVREDDEWVIFVVE